MALNDITFIKGQGGLGRPAAGQDYVSGILFYTDDSNLPSGFTTSDRIKEIFSVADAENLGILNDYSDATAAQSSLQITGAGSTGDTVKLVGLQPLGVSVTIGTYTRPSGDTTADLVATGVAAMINAGTYSHGYSADTDGDTVLINYPKKLGSFPNTGTPITVTATGITTGALTNSISGYHSRFSLWHYHISEYFRINPKGDLYVSLQPYPTTYDFAEITSLQDFAQGRIRQVAVYVKWVPFNTAHITAISNQIKNYCDANHKPLSALYAGKMTSISDLTTLTNLNTLSANKCSAVISQDGAGQGAFLAATSGQSITTLGATLGAVSLAAVSDDIAWIGKFNISDGTECDTLAFANGTLVSSLSEGTLSLLNDYRYIFLRKYVGISGSYFNDSHCAVVETSDYAYIENNRVIDKAIRGIYSSVLPALNSPLVLNADGTLTDETIAYFTSLAELNLTQMIRDVELSAMKVTIDSTQNVLEESKLVIGVQLLPIGVARNITVNIKFTTKIQ